MLSSYNKPEILSFSFQEIYLDRKLIKSREDLILNIKSLSKKYGYPANKIIFNHDFEDSNFRAEFLKNFTLYGSYDYLKDKLRARK